MEAAATTDGIYVGRYVLVKYTVKDPRDESNDYDEYFDKYEAVGNSGTKKVFIGYTFNANKDIEKFGDTFDATVWQKIYTNITGEEGKKEKYIMVAELNAAVPRLELEIISPKNLSVQGTTGTETWNSPSINPSLSSEDAYVFTLPDTLQLNVGTMNSDFYAKSLIDPATKKVIEENGNTLTHTQMLDTSHNYMKWINQRISRDGNNNPILDEHGEIVYNDILDDRPTAGPIDAKKLDTKLYAFGQIISDLYDALYGVPATGTGTRPFYTDDLANVLANYDKGLIGILTSIATDMKGDASKDLYGRTLQPGMYYYFTSKWCDAEEDPDSFIENIPRVVGSTAEKTEMKCHYKIDFAAGTLV